MTFHQVSSDISDLVNLRIIKFAYRTRVRATTTGAIVACIDINLRAFGNTSEPLRDNERDAR